MSLTKIKRTDFILPENKPCARRAKNVSVLSSRSKSFEKGSSVRLLACISFEDYNHTKSDLKGIQNWYKKIYVYDA